MTWVNLDQIFLPSFTMLSSQDSAALSCTAPSLRFEPTSEAEKDASNSCLVAWKQRLWFQMLEEEKEAEATKKRKSSQQPRTRGIQDNNIIAEMRGSYSL